MNRRLITSAALAAALTAAATACAPSDTTAAGTAAVNATLDTQSKTTDPGAPCTATFPSGSGISATHGTVTATVTLTCAKGVTLGISGLNSGVTVNLSQFTPQSGTQQAMTDPQTDNGDSHSVTASCEQPGSWRAYAVVTGTDGAGKSFAASFYGTARALTAADCANGGTR